MATQKWTKALGSLAIGLAVAALWPGASVAAPIAGFRVSTPVVDGLDVQVDLTAYVVNTGTGTPATFLKAGKAIDFTFSSNYVTSYDFGYGYAPTVYFVQRYFHSDWNTTAPPALDFGDFQSKQTVFLGLAPLAGNGRDAGEDDPIRGGAGIQGVFNVYRGSFAHSYATAGTYNVKAKLTPDGEAPTPGLGPATSGNPHYPTALTGSWIAGPTLVASRLYSVHIERTATPSPAVHDSTVLSIPSFASTLRYIENSVDSLIVDAIPAVTVKTPQPGSNFGGNTVINFVGDAFDAEDGDLTPSLTWSSDLDGVLGVGGNFFSLLSPGIHNVTASVMDSFGNVGMNSVLVSVAIGGPNFSVTAGVCPGLVSLEVAGVAPGDKVAFFTSNSLGTTVLGGACAGAVIDLDAAQLRSTRFGDGAGKVLVTRFFSLQQCGLLMQVINLGVGGSACSVSNTLGPPVPPGLEEPTVEAGPQSSRAKD